MPPVGAGARSAEATRRPVRPGKPRARQSPGEGAEHPQRHDQIDVGPHQPAAGGRLGPAPHQDLAQVARRHRDVDTLQHLVDEGSKTAELLLSRVIRNIE
jgi:hypothetical protein